MRHATVTLRAVAICDRCGDRGEAARTHDMGRDGMSVPLLDLRQEAVTEAEDGFTRAKVGNTNLLLCEPCLRLVQTALTPIQNQNEEDDR